MYANRGANREKKTCNIRTPNSLSKFLFELLSNKFKKTDLILDPCVGDGHLLIPWKEAGYKVEGIDIEEKKFPKTRKMDYLVSKKDDYKEKPKLILINPPFNIHKDMEEQDTTFKYLIESGWSKRPFLPEVFLAKTIELFGKDIPIILFTPYGMRFNLTLESRRFLKFDNGDYPEIKSIITLPKNIYNFDESNLLESKNKDKGIIFHSEILLFNLENLKAHYFLPKDLNYKK
ncbi:MAG: hypothetical protein mread185_000253 [Mycoplasmataceae bacterium]|nr:MAG: hypothetical protein mread185_000253 [Mycoplasmataceae bacterium]